MKNTTLITCLSILSLIGCASNQHEPQTPVATQSGNIFDDDLCMIKEEGLTFQDLRKDESTGNYITPAGTELVPAQAFAYFPGIEKLCLEGDTLVSRDKDWTRADHPPGSQGKVVVADESGEGCDDESTGSVDAESDSLMKKLSARPGVTVTCVKKAKPSAE